MITKAEIQENIKEIEKSIKSVRSIDDKETEQFLTGAAFALRWALEAKDVSFLDYYIVNDTKSREIVDKMLREVMDTDK